MEVLQFALSLSLLFGESRRGQSQGPASELKPLLSIAGTLSGLDLHLDGTDAGFFFEQSLGSSQQPLLKLPAHSQPNGSEHRPLVRERLAVLGPSAHPGRVLVSYGPFEAKQSLPSRHLALPPDNSTTEDQSMDISAHVVNGELRRESPVLRVLFHSGRHFHSAEHADDDAERPGDDWEDHEPASRLTETCIALRVHGPAGGGPLTATCSPKGLDGVCLASVTLPFDWWASTPISPTFPSLSTGLGGPPAPATTKPSKAVKNTLELSYSVYETKSGQCSDGRKFEQRPFPPASAVLVQPARPVPSARLVANAYAPRDLLVHEEAVTLSPSLRFIASAAPLYPHSFFYVSVVLDSTSAKDEPYAVVVRYRRPFHRRLMAGSPSESFASTATDVCGADAHNAAERDGRRARGPCLRGPLCPAASQREQSIAIGKRYTHTHSLTHTLSLSPSISARLSERNLSALRNTPRLIYRSRSTGRAK